MIALFVLLAATSEPVPGPVAVMPFKNLNQEASLDWLAVGMAETMISDLKRSGRVPVVERAQIDRALAELALQEGSLKEEDRAAKVGKIVGAKTAVIGSFQKAGEELRINARFVAVETGVVLDAAKATGPAGKVFALQDQVVDRLLGVSEKVKPPPRPARSRSPKVFDAYRLYAMALTVASDADRVGYLKQSIAVDPDFTYAVEDLAALAKRMKGYEEAADVKYQAAERDLYAKLDDGTQPAPDRVRSAVGLLDSLYGNRRFHTLAATADKLYARDDLSGAREHASLSRVRAAFALKKWDLALQLGEKHLSEFPGGPDFGAVDGLMKQMIQVRKTWARRKTEYDDDVKKQRDDLNDRLPSEQKALIYDYAPCIAATWNSEDNDLMLSGCSAFLDKHAAEHGELADMYVIDARFAVVRALVSRGDFEKAKPLAEKLMADTDRWTDALQQLLEQFPTD